MKKLTAILASLLLTLSNSGAVINASASNYEYHDSSYLSEDSYNFVDEYKTGTFSAVIYIPMKL